MNDPTPGEIIVQNVLDLEELRRVLERCTNLAGYAAALAEHAVEIDITAIALEGLHEEGDDLMSVAQTLKDNAASVRQSSEAVKTALDAAIARLSDNPTPADIAQVVDDLTAAKATNEASATAAASIDPDDTSGGVVTDPNGDGGVVEAPPA